MAWRRRRRLEAEHTCEMRIEHGMVYHSPDGRVFQVRRLVCAVCGHRERVVKQQGSTFEPPDWLQDDAVEANF